MRCFYYLVLFVACQSVLASDQATAIDMGKLLILDNYLDAIKLTSY